MRVIYISWFDIVVCCRSEAQCGWSISWFDIIVYYRSEAPWGWSWSHWSAECPCLEASVSSFSIIQWVLTSGSKCNHSHRPLKWKSLQFSNIFKINSSIHLLLNFFYELWLNWLILVPNIYWIIPYLVLLIFTNLCVVIHFFSP